MLGYRKHSFSRAHMLLRILRDNLENLEALRELQKLLLREVVRAEEKIRQHKSEIREIAEPKATSRFADVPMTNRFFTCGARLHPGTLSLLAGVPASEFADRAFSIEDVFGAQGRSLRYRLDDLRNTEEAVTILAEFLHERLGRQVKPDLRHILGMNHVQQLADRTGMPTRSLYANYMSRIGLSPTRKVVLRIERLQRALALHRLYPQPWINIALRAGFSDQAHMVREFNALIGESPSIWEARSSLPICSRQEKDSSLTVVNTGAGEYPRSPFGGSLRDLQDDATCKCDNRNECLQSIHQSRLYVRVAGLAAFTIRFPVSILQTCSQLHESTEVMSSDQ
jgi:AraC-like DNA-binding protein